MYIQLENNVLIKRKEIIGIFDLDNTTVSARTRNFLRKAEKNGQITLAGNELPKSFIVTGEKKNTKIFLSQLATSTLSKRNIGNRIKIKNAQNT